MILQAARPLIEWPEPLVELYGFVALFLAAGAVGFRHSALRATSGASTEAAQEVHRSAGRRAAVLGLVGALAGLYPLYTRLAGGAARAHLGIAAFVTSDIVSAATALCALLALVGFAVAIRGNRAGWTAALAGVVLGALSPLFAGQWSRLVNPVHSLAAGLWIGSLFVMVVAGIIPTLSSERARAERGAIVAAMVHGFSPLALVMGMIVVVFGLITAWKHLNPLSSLWSTPYGYALLAKLAFVAIVFGLGAWNWRRQRPTLGSDAAAVSIRRSSIYELAAAGIVLVLTALLISLPSPRPPKPAEVAPAGAAPGGAPPSSAPRAK